MWCLKLNWMLVLTAPTVCDTQVGIVKAAEYFSSLDLTRFKKPTKHTAHLNTEQIEGSAKKKQKV